MTADSREATWIQQQGQLAFVLTCILLSGAAGVFAFFITVTIAALVGMPPLIVLLLCSGASIGAIVWTTRRLRRARNRNAAIAVVANDPAIEQQLPSLESNQSQQESDHDTPRPNPTPRRRLFGGIPTRYAVGGAVALGVVVFLIDYFGNSLGLEVEWQRAALTNGVAITNVGSRPIRLLDVIINDRPDCQNRTALITGVPLGPRKPVDLAVGDREIVFTSCEVIRVSVKTDRGDATYRFSR